MSASDMEQLFKKALTFALNDGKYQVLKTQNHVTMLPNGQTSIIFFNVLYVFKSVMCYLL